MAWEPERKEADNGSAWAFSTQPGSSTITQETPSGLSPFSTDPTKNWGQRTYSNWGEEPRIDDTPHTRPWLWRRVARLFGGQ